MDDPREAAFQQLRELHGRVDQRARQLSQRHGPRLHCGRGCSACCLDELSVFEVEAERIRREHPELLRSGAAGPVGACAFLDAEGGCRVYSSRPQVCRTQGLPLRAFHEDAEGELVEERDICPLNAEGESLDQLDDEELWTLGEVELQLQALQQRFGGDQARVRLRDLFERGEAGGRARS